MERMCQDGHKPELEIYNELIKSFCQGDFVAEALLLKVEMADKKMKPDLVAYGAVIGCLSRLGRSMEGESLVGEMIASGLVPDLAICRDLFNGYCRENNFDYAESLLVFFAREFQIRDSQSFSELMRITSAKGDIGRSLEIQDMMLKIGLLPNPLTCKYVIDGLWKARSVDSANLMK